MSIQALKAFIKEAVRDVVMSSEYDEDVLRKYISTRHVQNVHGHVYDFDDFLRHTRRAKGDIKVEKVEYIELIAEDNKVCAHYDVHATKSSGEPLVVRIMVIFHVEKGKIVRCHELSHVLVGDRSDSDIAYRL